MLKIKVTEKSGASIEYVSPVELDYTALGHGLPAREEIGEDGQPTGVVLPAEYTVEIEDVSAQLEQERINGEALEYLASTDWLIIREIDAGIPCPAEIKQARAEARARIVR